MGAENRSGDAIGRLRRLASEICRARLVVPALILVFIVGITACQRPPNAAPVDAPRGGEVGKRLFAVHCANCHGEKGDRLPVAPLGSKEFLDSRGDATLLAMISEGKGTMPGFSKGRGGPLTDEEISALVAYVSTAAGRNSASGLAEAGKQLFGSTCTTCHGEKGDRIPIVPLSAKGYLDNRTDSELVRAITEGKGVMPAFGKGSGQALTDQQIKSIVAYLRFTVDSNVAASARLGRDLYMGNCLSCHGERGDRIPGSNLPSAEFLTKLGDGGLISAVNEGKGVMPGFGRAKGGSFSVADTAALLAYVKSWAGVSATSALAGVGVSGEGKDLFVRNCVPCHGDGGDKVAGVRLKSTDYLQSRTDAVILQTINDGNSKGMPAWGKSAGGPFSTEQTKSILDFLKSSAGTAPASSKPAASTPAVSTPAASTPTAPDARPLSTDVAASASKGKEVFTKNCVGCHGETRDKIPTCKLADKEWVAQKGDEGLTNSIANGKGPMPAWGKAKGGALGDDDIKSVVAYLKQEVGLAAGGASGTGAGTSAAGGAGTADLAALAGKGKEVFTKNCVACHGETRDKIPTCKLADKEWVSQKGDEGLTNSIANGKGPMPAWGKAKGGALGDDDIKSVVAYLKQEVGLTGGSGGAAAAGTTASVAPAATPVASVDEPRIVPTADIGKELFVKNCTACHGEDGLRVKQCPLGSRAWLNNTSEEGLRARITGGKPAAGMPTWGKVKGGPLSDSQITAVMLYLNAAAK